MASVLPKIEGAGGGGPAFDPGSPRGAVDVLKVYYSMIGAKRYSDATIWREDAGPKGPLSQAAFDSEFARYASYSAKVGEAGPPEGPRGSVYVLIPVEIHAQLKAGGEVTEHATAEMHLVNDTDQPARRPLSWRIARIDKSSGK